ncbi:UDP-glucuronosyl/UDP-glucosyltransferase [Trema orientale]|uniref:UDP-glucuronosyl/UDP-glucosyltransferase n=1 Tax=Trema orientale TaxID=63057 RepID=A0A2P5E901_TREOI|nr:UDP-glucuronosyl/UDP-glucosyltransferase [Trema orientale]
MASEAPIEIYFFPFVGGGHQIPMIDMARVFASHGAKATLIAAPSNALNFQNAVVRDQLSGRPITIHSLRLPDGAPMPDPEMSAAPFTDTSALLEPLSLLLVERPPDCIVVDAFHRWAPDVIDELGVMAMAASLVALARISGGSRLNRMWVRTRSPIWFRVCLIGSS